MLNGMITRRFIEHGVFGKGALSERAVAGR